MFVCVTRLGDISCNLSALVDTGSPISFIRYDVFRSFFKNSSERLEPTSGSYSIINDSRVQILGKFRAKLVLQELPARTLEIQLHVIPSCGFRGDLILGRDVINEQRLTFVFRPSSDTRDFNVDATPFVLFHEDIFARPDRLEEICATEIDFDAKVKRRLVETVLDARRSVEPLASDDYFVTVNLKDDSAFAYAPRRLAFAERGQIREITDDLLKRGIIKESSSQYCSRIVPVRKKDGTLRLCVDLRPLNARVLKQKYPFPLIEDCLARLAGKSVFTLLDLKDGFHQIRIHPDSTKYFSFATPDGQFEYTSLPFGFSEAPAEFQKRIVQLLRPLIREDKVIVYIDDILIATDSVESNFDVLRQVLGLFGQRDFELNYGKCQFLRRKVEFLGYIVSGDGVSLSERHMEAVRSFPRPANVHDVRRFLGLVSYFRKFIADFALIARPLQNLLRASVKFGFDETCEKAFVSLKQKLTAHPTLQLFDPAAETQLHTDASVHGLGAILSQRRKGGDWAPIAYLSQTTNQAETRYHSFELEMLAIVRAVERLHIYLYGLDFTVVTDCNACMQ